VFDYLPIAGEGDVYEQHIATPTGLDFARAAQLYGFRHERPATLAELQALLAEPAPETLIEVCTDRATGVELHRRVAAAVAASGSS
jgi:2-succinyl-5-enolpyruvyl-6-hydroxy-3-cyclohexene-1-carboxylate synthase